MVIESSDNTKFKLFKSLLTTKGIKKNKLCIISGRKIVPEFINDSSVYAIVANENNITQLSPSNENQQVTLFKDGLFSQLDSNGTNFPLLIFKIPEILDYNFSNTPSGLEVISGLGDPSNQGALIRSCEAFSASKVILLKNSCHPFLPRTIKASSGSALRIPLFNGPFINELPNENFYSLDKSGKNLKLFDWPKNMRLLMGEEGPGFPKDLRPIDQLSISMESSIESLNATIATSIALYSYYQHHQ